MARTSLRAGDHVEITGGPRLGCDGRVLRVVASGQRLISVEHSDRRVTYENRNHLRKKDPAGAAGRAR